MLETFENSPSDCGYDSETTCGRLRERGLVAEISKKGKLAPLTATTRRVVERSGSWHNAHKKLVWCTERKGWVIDYRMTFSEVVIIREAPHQEKLESLPLEGSTFSPTITYFAGSSKPHGRLHFAGTERSSWPNNMEGALESGERAAREISERQPASACA